MKILELIINPGRGRFKTFKLCEFSCATFFSSKIKINNKFSSQPANGFTRVKSPTTQIHHIPQEPENNATSSTQINRTQYTQDWEKIINEGFADAAKSSSVEKPETPKRKPPIARKPKIP